MSRISRGGVGSIIRRGMMRGIKKVKSIFVIVLMGSMGTIIIQVGERGSIVRGVSGVLTAFIVGF